MVGGAALLRQPGHCGFRFSLGYGEGLLYGPVVSRGFQLMAPPVQRSDELNTSADDCAAKYAVHGSGQTQCPVWSSSTAPPPATTEQLEEEML